MQWYNSESMTRPEEVDTTSSNIYNYVRRNIREVTEEQDGEQVTKYAYEECRIPKEAWGLYEELVSQGETNLQQQADIDYLTMITEDL